MSKRCSLLIVIAIMLLVLCLGCSEKITQGDVDIPTYISIYIQNNTSENIFYCYFSRPDLANWSNRSNIFLSPGSQDIVRIPSSFMDNQGRADILLLLPRGDGYKWYIRKKQYITQNGTIIFTDDNIVSSIAMTIFNDTGTTNFTGYVRLPGLIGWTEMTIHNTTGNSQLVNIPAFCIDDLGMADLQIFTSYPNYSVMTKLRQIITPNGTIHFTTSDIEPTISVNIVNNTGFDIYNVNIRLPETANWREVNNSISNNNSHSISIPMSFIDSQSRVDVQLRRGTSSEYSVYFTKAFHTIIANDIIVFTASDFDSSSPIPITIQNDTSTTALVYFKAPGTTDWHNILRWDEVVPSGSSIQVGIPLFMLNKSNRSDIQMRAANGIWYAKLNQFITYGCIITFTLSDLDPTLRIFINNTGLDIYSSSIKLPGTTIWTNEETNIGLPSGDSQFLTIPVSVINNQGKSDIQLKTADGVLFTKLNQFITSNGTLIFTASDLNPIGATPVTIVNNTPADISGVYGRLPGTTEWKYWLSYNGVLIQSNSSRLVSVTTSNISSQEKADIQIRSFDGLLYTKINQDIIPFGSISFSASDFDPSGSCLVYIENNLGVSIGYGYARLPGTTNWTSLFSATVSDGGTRAIGIPQILINSQGRSDLQLQTSNGVRYTKTDHIITSNGVITFTASDFDPTGSRPITIQNNTGGSISYGYAKMPGSTSWNSIFSSSLSNGSSRSVIIPLSCIDNESRSDLQLRTSNYSNEVLYTKLNQMITVNGVITFTAGDIDPRQVTIVNNTGVNISSGYVRLPGTTSWSSLSLYGLSNGSSQQVSISSVYLDNQSRADLQLRTTSSSGVIYTRLSQNISHNGTITFTAGDIDADSPYPVTIHNNTGYTINYGYARLPGSVNWVNLFTSTLSNGSSTATVIPLSVISNSRTDLQLRTSSGVWFTKLNQVIVANGTIIFTGNDVDL